MLKKFPTNKYMDCPIPKHHWETIQEYADYYATQQSEKKSIAFAEFLRQNYIVSTGYKWRSTADITKIFSTEQLYHSEEFKTFLATAERK
jgi:hypothetical protein